MLRCCAGLEPEPVEVGITGAFFDVGIDAEKTDLGPDPGSGCGFEARSDHIEIIFDTDDIRIGIVREYYGIFIPAVAEVRHPILSGNTGGKEQRNNC